MTLFAGDILTLSHNRIQTNFLASHMFTFPDDRIKSLSLFMTLLVSHIFTLSPHDTIKSTLLVGDILKLPDDRIKSLSFMTLSASSIVMLHN
jgi:hypothetical protein